ncbi:TRAP transporter small permease subunit [Stappia sp. GBMRC 2046]|uniref:TRAP transporter small permease protein n=1 Tax=Stappia sediminis TaxID=2692190 RepID=A0A7X3S5T0_9HYPH|nr:TRAP transporter small permease [Stappia sediminis]MXN63452.1 TRAP transporter small permease subunit [Stappia sediminis]
MNRFDQWFDRLLVALAALAGAIFASIAILIPVNVVLRNAFGTSIYGLLDAIEYGLLAATFLAAPWVLANNAHVTVDLLTGSLRPGARRIADIAVNLLGAAVSAVFLWYALEALDLSFTRGSMIRTAFVIPEWWTLTVAPLSMALIFIEFLRKLARPASAERAATGL